jgi:hypothetical protein
VKLADDREDARAALALITAAETSVVAKAHWLPMETAPKNDMEEILVLFDSATVNIVRLCWWNDGSELMNGMELRPESVGWWSYKHSVTSEPIEFRPLGWMPLPARP